MVMNMRRVAKCDPRSVISSSLNSRYSARYDKDYRRRFIDSDFMGFDGGSSDIIKLIRNKRFMAGVFPQGG